MLYRHQNEVGARVHSADTKDMTEWAETNKSNYDIKRLDDPAWEQRYEHEASLIVDIIQKYPPINKILELGSGPGVLSQKIQNKIVYPIDYHLIDKPIAQQVFNERNYKGKFFVKDMSEGLDIEGLSDEYDLVIANDFLEHIFNPSHIMRQCHSLLREGGKCFISVPNWRMGHNWIYRGLFDYDNWLLFMEYHNFNYLGWSKSPLNCPFSPKLTSETHLPDELVQSWNFYTIFEKVTIEQ